jgi:hypothetical protein
MSSSVQRLDGVAVGVEAGVATGVGVGVGGAAAYVLATIFGIKMEYRTKAVAHISAAMRIRILIMISPVPSSTRTRSIEPLALRTFSRAAIRSPLSLEPLLEPEAIVDQTFLYALLALFLRGSGGFSESGYQGSLIVVALCGFFNKSLCNQDRPDGVVDNVGLALLLAFGGTFHGGNGIGWQT